MCIFYGWQSFCMETPDIAMAAAHSYDSQNVKFICIQFIEYNAILFDGIIWNEWRLFRVKRPTYQSGIIVPYFLFCDIFGVILLLLLLFDIIVFSRSNAIWWSVWNHKYMETTKPLQDFSFFCCCHVGFNDCTSHFHTENVTLHRNYCTDTNTVASWMLKAFKRRMGFN